MITSCNPGSWLEVVGSFKIVEGDLEEHAVDLESGQRVSLPELLRSFSYDPMEAYTGLVKITILPAASHAW